MAQHLFASDTSLSLVTLDSNFNDLYDLRGYVATPGYAPASPKITLAASGVVGLGVSPSAWGYVALQLSAGSLWTASTTTLALSQNAYNSGSGYLYTNAGKAAQYGIVDGAHYWYEAGPGTAGAAVTGFGSAAMTLDGSSNLLVGYTSSNGAYKLQVNSQIFATSGTIATSDARYKQNVKPLTSALDLVNKLRPVTFEWKQHPVHNFPAGRTTGFLAQEVQQALRDAGHGELASAIVKSNECVIQPAVIQPAVTKTLEGIGGAPAHTLVLQPEQLVAPEVKEEFLGLAEGNLIAVLTAALQELAAEVAALKAKVG